MFFVCDLLVRLVHCSCIVWTNVRLTFTFFQNTKNKEIWETYPLLQVVKPSNFSWFVRECFRAAGVDKKKTAIDDDDDYVDKDDASGASYIDPIGTTVVTRSTAASTTAKEDD
jgi:hypothetical protein